MVKPRRLGPIKPRTIRKNPSRADLMESEVKSSVYESEKLARRLQELVRIRSPVVVPDILDHAAHLIGQVVLGSKALMSWTKLTKENKSTLRRPWSLAQRMQKHAASMRLSVGLSALRSKIDWKLVKESSDGIVDYVNSARIYSNQGALDRAVRKLTREPIGALLDGFGFQVLGSGIDDSLDALRAGLI